MFRLRPTRKVPKERLTKKTSERVFSEILSELERADAALMRAAQLVSSLRASHGEALRDAAGRPDAPLYWDASQRAIGQYSGPTWVADTATHCTALAEHVADVQWAFDSALKALQEKRRAARVRAIQDGVEVEDG